MAHIVQRNAAAAEDPTAYVPLTDAGMPYRYEVIFDGGLNRGYAETLDDVADMVLPSVDADEHDRDAAALSARITHALRTRVHLQAAMLAAHQDTERSDAEDAALNSPTPPSVQEWTSAIPLVLIDTFYAPYTDVPCPLSSDGDVAEPANIIWLRPATPNGYLHTLLRAGIIAIFEHESAAAN